MDTQDTITIDLRDLFLLLKKHLLAIVAAAVLFAAVGGLYTKFLVTPQYEASATLIVNSREDQTGQTGQKCLFFPSAVLKHLAQDRYKYTDRCYSKNQINIHVSSHLRSGSQ